MVGDRSRTEGELCPITRSIYHTYKSRCSQLTLGFIDWATKTKTVQAKPPETRTQCIRLFQISTGGGGERPGASRCCEKRQEGSLGGSVPRVFLFQASFFGSPLVVLAASVEKWRTMNGRARGLFSVQLKITESHLKGFPFQKRTFEPQISHERGFFTLRKHNAQCSAVQLHSCCHDDEQQSCLHTEIQSIG